MTALDPYGNVATGYTGTAVFLSSDGQAALPAGYAFGAGDAGTHAFAVTLKTAGSQTVSVSDGPLNATSGAIAVGPAAAASFTVDAPASATAGTASSITVTAKDAYGNVATGYTGTVGLTSTDAQAALPAAHAFAAGDAGVHLFSVTLKTAASQTVSASDGSIGGTSAAVAVGPGAVSASTSTTAASPASVVADGATSVAVTVTLEDAYGNVVAGQVGLGRGGGLGRSVSGRRLHGLVRRRRVLGHRHRRRVVDLHGDRHERLDHGDADRIGFVRGRPALVDRDQPDVLGRRRRREPGLRRDRLRRVRSQPRRAGRDVLDHPGRLVLRPERILLRLCVRAAHGDGEREREGRAGVARRRRGVRGSGATSTLAASLTSIVADGASTSTITVTLKDSYGNSLGSGGDAVVLSTTDGMLSSVTDNGNGTYTATLTAPVTPGSGTVSGTVNGDADHSDGGRHVHEQRRRLRPSSARRPCSPGR